MMYMSLPQEKWDSMTRKWKDNCLLQLVRLFLIDEVSLSERCSCIHSTSILYISECSLCLMNKKCIIYTEFYYATYCDGTSLASAHSSYVEVEL